MTVTQNIKPKTFFGINPRTGQTLTQEFTESTTEEINNAVAAAEAAFEAYRAKTSQERAAFLEKIGEEIMGIGETLIKTCAEETGLPEGRLTGERGRTVNQLKLFAELLREGSWVQAIIETAQPDRQPLPKPDTRSMQIPLGPVGVFGASNFPLAFSVAGGDTASALAAGCPVVAKAHPAHPATSQLVADAILRAAAATNMPDGVFAIIQGPSVEVGMMLVQHPLIKAIGFTGSFRGGKAIYDAAVRRPEPIPVYAEMGSTNPVFVLPGALQERKEALAQGLVNSITMGVGQFCTNPGLVISLASDETNTFVTKAGEILTAVQPGTMLTPTIKNAYDQGVQKLSSVNNVQVIARGPATEDSCAGSAHLLKTDAATFVANPELAEEVFGPSSVVITADTKEQLLEIARNLHGHLTATIHGTPNDLEEYRELISVLERKVGRLLLNGYPTGVEVGHAMVHGGPYPATTDARSTSVGTAAINRYVRPVCYQDFPDQLLPAALQNANPLNIWRKVNGTFSQNPVS
ncbi:MAG: aldehyde dehydrogenase (NADP(+)) [Adhaeribacter sp.]